MAALYSQELIDFTVRDIVLRAIDYKPTNSVVKKTIIALHGWLDNAGSFYFLAPKLAEQGFRVIALDLAGQGLSDMRPLQGTYHLWDDAVDVLTVADSLGLESFYLLGHSRGAMIASQLAAAFPEKIAKLCVLDGLLPIPVAMEETVEQLRKFALGFQRRRDSRAFSSREEAIQVRAKAARMDVAAVELLAERGLLETQDNQSWQWRVDERLKIASALKMTNEHNQHWLSALVNSGIDTQVILAEQGLAQLPLFDEYQQQRPQINWLTLPGGHHQHMQAQADEVAQLCTQFFLK